MASEWSHTPEAYATAYENLHNKPHYWLAMCLAEIDATPKDEYGCYSASDMNSEKYDKRREQLESLPSDVLADAIWAFAEEYRTCDNGGFNAHVCPHGCHTVSFSNE